MSSRAKLLWVMTCVVAVVVCLGVTVSISRHLVSNRRSACIGHLYQLGMVLRMYALEHEGIYPDQWAAVVDSMHETDLRLFLAPWNHRTPGEKATVDSWAHCTLVSGRSISDPSNTVLAFGACETDGGCVLFVDGHVGWAPSQSFRTVVSTHGKVDLVMPGQELE